MIFAMIFAHLTGDYLLQWDSLAAWKSRDLRGVGVHGLIVTLVTLILANWVDSRWWLWALGIGLAHLAIDTAQFYVQRRLPRYGLFPLSAYCADQLAHALVIFGALRCSGYLPTLPWPGDWLALLQGQRLTLTILTYTFISLPAWVLIEFLSYGLAKGSGPDFAEATQTKVVGILERSLMLTFAWQGYMLLLPLIALPRWLTSQRDAATVVAQRLLTVRLLVSMLLTVAAGLLLQRLIG